MPRGPLGSTSPVKPRAQSQQTQQIDEFERIETDSLNSDLYDVRSLPASRSPSVNHADTPMPRSVASTKSISDFLKHVKADFPTLTIGENSLQWRHSVILFAQLIEATFALRPMPTAKTPLEAHELFLELGQESPIPASMLYSSSSDTEPLPDWCSKLNPTLASSASETSRNSYAERVLDNELKSTRVWIGINKITKLPILESDIDTQKRTVLFQAMLKSMSKYRLLTAKVIPGDCFTLFDTAVKTEEPEPRAVLVSACNRLVTCKKTADIPFQQWNNELESIYEQLATVGLDVTKIPNDLFRLGFTLAAIAHDKRYDTAVESCKDKELSYDQCMIKLRHHSNDIGDLLGKTQKPTPHEANTQSNNRKGDGRNSRGRGGRGTKGQRPPSQEAMLAFLEALPISQRPGCPVVCAGKVCEDKSCLYRHVSMRGGKGSKGNQSQHSATTPNVADTPKTADKKPCFEFRRFKRCTGGGLGQDSCPYSHDTNDHSNNMVDIEPVPTINVGDTVELSFTTADGIHIPPTRGIVTKTFLAKNSVRYYHVDVPNAAAVHAELP